MAAPIEEPDSRLRLPLATSVFLLFALLVSAVVGVAVWVTYQRGAQIASQALDRQLRISAAVQNELAQRRLEEAQFKVQLIAADAAFVKYVNDAQASGLGLGVEEELGSASISDLLNERQRGVGFDLGIVLDGSGNVLARTDQSEAFAQNLGGDAFLRSAFDGPKPISGYWRLADRLYQAAVWPLELDGDLAGYLVVALAVDRAIAERIGKASGADLAFLLPVNGRWTVLGTSLAPDLVPELESAPQTQSFTDWAGKSDARIDWSLKQRPWVGQASLVDEAGGPQLGIALRLAPTDLATAGYREILNVLLVSGGAALLVALPLSLLLARVTLRPLRRLSEAAREAASGRYQTRIALRGKDPLAQLSQSFDRLLSDLREKNDMQGYVNNLARYLPEPSRAVREAAGPARAARESSTETRVLMGVDWHAFCAGLQTLAPEAQVRALETKVRDAQRALRDHQAELLSGCGHRWVWSYRGPQRMQQACAGLRALYALEDQSCVGLIEGSVTSGDVQLQSEPVRAALGSASAQLDRLLAEAGPGYALMSRACGEAIRALLPEPSVEIASGALTQKPYYALRAQRILQEPWPLGTAADRPTTQAPAAAASPPPAVRTTQEELQPGTRFGGRYEILSVLGAGGMGVVYQAHDCELDDVVALKMLKPAALGDAEHLERLKSEIKLARRITHPNVLRTFDFGEAEGKPYISMEYVRGMTLRYLMNQAGRLPYSAALRIAQQLCLGLDAAHRVGVIHRDIKPENLILESSGNTKLMDFGIARPVRRVQPGQTQPGMFVGTPHYCAPEQLAAEELDHRADLYSVGVLLCEMFCGRLPFSGQSTMDVYIAQMQRDPPKPSSFWPEISKPLETLILRCMARDPAQRYDKAIEVHAVLETLRA